eukprot:CAMPEP_0118667952 /NCGR_PEP_ID=MMETSP0785-20121206/20074_1 /TAXON_ID=91992 /ORGANISM="Bolidomonas pacifica, Strain CCMP 1866" /LENGTH=213 /DNA_ID=CAMNT_0006562467 /DNA_START=203 /DNA_END=844 /DNA_ORIENTATION=-
MSKEELSAWRKNQRRLRNRQSAAASRQKQKDRIEELEAEVESLKTRLKFYEKSFPFSASTSAQPPQSPLPPPPPPPTYLTRQRSVPISPPNSPTLSYVSSQNQLNKPKRSAVYGAHGADPVLTGEDDAVAATGWEANYDDEEVTMLEKMDYDEDDEDDVVSRTSSSGLSSSGLSSNGFSGNEDEGGGGASPDFNIHADQDLADFLLDGDILGI